MMNVRIRDESMNREMLQELCVVLSADRITARELICTRVRQESAATMPVDCESELRKALDAFITNRIVIFVDDRQVKSLDEMIEINSETKISFLRLTFVLGS